MAESLIPNRSGAETARAKALELCLDRIGDPLVKSGGFSKAWARDLFYCVLFDQLMPQAVNKSAEQAVERLPDQTPEGPWADIYAKAAAHLATEGKDQIASGQAAELVRKLQEHSRTDGFVHTEPWLESMVLRTLDRNLTSWDSKDEDLFERILSGFETSGKIHQQYPSQRGRGLGPFDLVECYLLFAVACLVCDAMKSAPRKLNAALKANDLAALLLENNAVSGLSPLALAALPLEKASLEVYS